MAFSRRPSFVAAVVLLVVALLAGCAGSPVRRETVTLRGRVLAADGSPPRKARVVLLEVPEAESRPVRSVTPGPDGRFALEVPVGQPCYLRVAAVYHDEAIVPVHVASGDAASVEVRLRPVELLPEPQRVFLQGSWMKLEGDGVYMMEMEPQPDGTWAWEGPVEPGEDGRVSFQVRHATRGHGVPGSPAEDFLWAGRAGWRAVVRAPEGGILRVTFDPAAIPRAGDRSLPEVAWDGDHAWLARLWRPWQRRRVLADRAMRLAMEAPGGDPTAAPAFRKWLAEWRELRDELESLAEGDGPPPLRSWAWVLWLVTRPGPDAPGGEGEAEGAAEVTDLARSLLAPRSPWWVEVETWRMPRLVAELIREEDVDRFLARLARENPVGRVRAAAMACLLERADERGDREAARRWWRALWEAGREDPELAGALEEYDPDRPVQVGRPLPAFSVTTVDGRTLTDRDLRGKVVLLDFWATWCEPCVEEMPVLHEAYEKFHGRGFEIVSIGVSMSRDDLAAFRRGKWKMPWTHVVLPEGRKSELARAFRVNGIPVPILVGRDGTIVAVEPETRGRDLLAAVEKTLGEDGD